VSLQDEWKRESEAEALERLTESRDSSRWWRIRETSRSLRMRSTAAMEEPAGLGPIVHSWPLQKKVERETGVVAPSTKHRVEFSYRLV
jgi:hypothetical protein